VRRRRRRREGGGGGGGGKDDRAPLFLALILKVEMSDNHSPALA
jgi:hypothetical protein